MNLNQLKELAQKKKGRDVPCDALESALEIIEQASKVTRFEVITQDGRAYVNNKCNIELSYQDDGRTLKVFVK